MPHKPKRRPFALIYTCANPQCLQAVGSEASSEERGDRVYITCGLCCRRRDYPTDSLTRDSIGQSLNGYFFNVEPHSPPDLGNFVKIPFQMRNLFIQI